MPKSKQQKNEDLTELAKRLADAKSVVFTEFRGTGVKDVDRFRRALEKEQVATKVYKLTLVKKALAEKGIDVTKLDFKVPVVLAISNEDETQSARAVKQVAKDIKTLGMLGGVVDGVFLNKAQIEALADMPGKLALRAQLVGTMNAPISGFVTVLAGNLRGLLNVLTTVAQKS